MRNLERIHRKKGFFRVSMLKAKNKREINYSVDADISNKMEGKDKYNSIGCFTVNVEHYSL